MRNTLIDATVFMPLGGLGIRARKYTRGRYSKFLIPLRRDYLVLDFSIDSMLEVGFRKFVFCVGTLFSGEIVEAIYQHKDQFDALGVEYKFSYERVLMGGVGAYNKAIREHKVTSSVISVPGDMLLPWRSFFSAISFHEEQKSDITIGLIDEITEHTSDVGKIWVDQRTNGIVRCLARAENAENSDPKIMTGTSAGIYIFQPKKLQQLYKKYQLLHPELEKSQIEMRDQILPYAIHDPAFRVTGVTLAGEILDVGEYDRILYAKENWQRFAVC